MSFLLNVMILALLLDIVVRVQWVALMMILVTYVIAHVMTIVSHRIVVFIILVFGLLSR